MKGADGRHFISDETARFSALCMVYVSLNAFGFTILFREPPNTMRDIIIALMGSLTTIFVQQVQYYNKTGVTNDRKKDDSINKLITTSASLQQASNPAPVTTLQAGDAVTIAASEDEPATKSS